MSEDREYKKQEFSIEEIKKVFEDIFLNPETRKVLNYPYLSDNAKKLLNETIKEEVEKCKDPEYFYKHYYWKDTYPKD